MPGLELSDTQRGAELVNAHLADIDAAIACVARKNRLNADEREELTGRVYLKLVERDGAVLRQFSGRSSLRTYLIVVIQRLLLDDRITQWGKWRPSRRTRREGPAAVLLDRLVAREGLPPDQACAVVRSIHGPHACEKLEHLVEQLPARIGRYRVDEGVLDTLPSQAADADRLVASSERRRVMRRTAATLANAVAALPVDDRMILRLRFVENLNIREIARRLGLPWARSKQLYARIQRQLAVLRRAIEQAGLSRTEILDAIGAPETPAIPVFAVSRASRASAARPPE